MKRTNYFFKKSLLAGSLSFCLLFSSCKALLPVEEEPMKPPLVAPTEINYTTVKVIRDQLKETLRSAVNISSSQKQDLSFIKRGGYLQTLNMPITVKKDDIIAKYDTKNLEADIENAEMDLVSAKSSLNELLNNKTDTYSVDLKMSYLKIEQLEEQYRATKNRLGSVLTTEEQLTLDMMKLEIEKAKIEYETLLNKNTTKNPDVEIAEFRVKQAENTLTHLREELSYCTLTAPFDGTIISWDNSLALGSYVNANQSLGIIVDTSKLVLLVNSNEKLKKLFDKNTVLTVDVFINQDFENPHKAELSPYIDPNTKESIPETPYQLIFNEIPKGIQYENGYYSIDTSITDEKRNPVASYLTYGSNSLLFSALIESRDNVLMIPTSSIRMIEDGTNETATVSVLENGVKIDRTITVGYKTDSMIEVISGLEEGEEVIIR